MVERSLGESTAKIPNKKDKSVQIYNKKERQSFEKIQTIESLFQDLESLKSSFLYVQEVQTLSKYLLNKCNCQIEMVSLFI